MKLLFLPFSIIAGLIAGKLAERIFDGIWRLFDEEEAPGAEHREVPVVKLVLALAIQGAVFRLVRGLVDHGARHGWQNLTGSWPGEEAPEKA
jgi:hypothetical protein